MSEFRAVGRLPDTSWHENRLGSAKTRELDMNQQYAEFVIAHWKTAACEHPGLGHSKKMLGRARRTFVQRKTQNLSVTKGREPSPQGKYSAHLGWAPILTPVKAVSDADYCAKT
jgi:hypothetical protein